MRITLDDVREFADQYLVPFAVHAIEALAVFVVGRMVARMILRGLDGVMIRSKLDVSLRKFLGDVAYAGMLSAITVVALDSLGVKTTAVVAVLGAAGLAVGLALQGSLSNAAAGVMLIVLRPYKVSDLVVIGKYTGRVDAIKVFHTVLITFDAREITIPNGQIISAPIENLTVIGRRRVELLVTLWQPTQIADMRAKLLAVAAADTRVQAAPPAAVDVLEVSDSGAKLYLRPWTTAENYAAVSADLVEATKTALGAEHLKFTITPT